MKLILKQHLSGADGVFAVGDSIEVTDLQAISFIEKGIAEPKTKKELEDFLAKVDGLKVDQLEKEKAASAILYKEELEDERAKLQIRVDEITDTLSDAGSYYKQYANLGKGK